MMPALTDAVVAAPAKTKENMVTSLETRVLAVVPKMHPAIGLADKTVEKQVFVVAAPNPNHPLGANKVEETYRSIGMTSLRLMKPMPKPKKGESNPDLEGMIAGMNLKERVIILDPPGNTFASYKQEWASAEPFVDSIWKRGRSETNGKEEWSYQMETSIVSSFGVRRGGGQSTLQNGVYSKSVRLANELPTGLYRGLSKTRSISTKENPMAAETRLFMQTEGMAWANHPLRPKPFEEWVKRYGVARRAELTKAREEVEAAGLLAKDANVKNFIKIETSNKCGDPRNISPPSDKLLVIMGPYLSTLDDASHDCPFMIKGKNIKDRDKHMKRLSEYEFFAEIDFSRYDQTLCDALLACMQDEQIRTSFPEDEHALFHEALRLARKFKGVSEYGTFYTQIGTRRSGDVTTSNKNGTMAKQSIWSVLRRLPRGSWYAFCEGDDIVIGFRYVDKKLAEYLLSYLWVLGLMPKINIFDSLSDTTFCGRFYADSVSGLVSYCDPLRSLSKFHTTISSGDPKALLLAKSLSYYFCDGHVPIIGSLCKSLIILLRDQVSDRRIKRALAFNFKNLSWNYQLAGIKIDWKKVRTMGLNTDVRNDLRGLFHYRTGVSPDVQKNYEKEFESWIKYGVPSSVGRIPVEWELGGDTKRLNVEISNYII